MPADELPITIYEKEILEKLGITDCITALELFSKIIPAFYTVKAFRSILGILKSENTEMIDFLLKTEKLEGEILSCCANGVSPSLAKEIHNCGTHTPDYYDLLDKIIRYEKLSKILSLRYEYYCKPYEQIHSIKELDNDTAEAELYLEYEKGKIHNQQAGADYYIMRPSVTFHQLTCSGLRQMSERLSQSDISII
ncbi:MAG: hypothetical protein C0602_05880 [Denitrovibrio sp.]|nr:MAG: hypothetical protein C0602_05880 [Denitrovibrio sp.]